MTPRELEICARVHIVRKEIAKSKQPELAREMGITQNQLAGIEYGRTPLRYGNARFLCERFGISQRWLAIGALPMKPAYKIPMRIYLNYTNSTLFSKAFDDILDEPTLRVETEWIKEFGEKNFRAGNFDGFYFPQFQPLSTAFVHGAFSNFTKAFSISFNWLPDDLQLIYSEALISAHKSFAKKYSAQLATLQPPAARKFLGQTFEVRKNGLTDAETSEKLGAVNHPFKKLLADLRQATSAPGEMSALAKYLGEKTGANVPLASVSRWLSGKREPGGEITLWMREWVTDSKRQK